jgi:hypothetical protein
MFVNKRKQPQRGGKDNGFEKEIEMSVFAVYIENKINNGDKFFVCVFFFFF